VTKRMTVQQTIFHITNYKAGSQWVAEILKHSTPERFITPEVAVGHFFEHAIIPGRVYPTVYVTKEQFTWTLLKGWSPRVYKSTNITKNILASVINRYHFRFQNLPFKTFVIIRDLRDILVSHYYSLLIGHKVISQRIKTDRDKLSEMNKDDGLLFLLENRLLLHAQIQTSWLAARQRNEGLFLRYEELIEDEYSTFEKIIEYCQIDVKKQKLHEIIKYNSFGTATGRKRGEENVKEHLRKGIAGDWKNHFSSALKKEFKKRYGQVLINTGYEKNLEW